MTEEEYEETKNETLEQLGELNESLSKIKEGNLSLINDVNGIQLAIQAAISQAFRTPEVIQMFAKQQQGQLRQKLADVCLRSFWVDAGEKNNFFQTQKVEQSMRLNKIAVEDGTPIKVEILFALKKLGEKLNENEDEFLNQNIGNQSNGLKQFELATNSIGKFNIYKNSISIDEFDILRFVKHRILRSRVKLENFTFG
jgi:hypothetical protein